MNSDPQIVTIVLNWNGREVTADCLGSLLASDYENLTVLVVDNGSEDGSIEYLEDRFPAVDFLSSPANLGFTGGNNLGINYVLSHYQSAKYILLLNNDTVIHPDCIPHLVRTAEGEPNYGALNPKIYYADPPNRLWYAGGAFSLCTGTTKHWGRKVIDEGQFDEPRKVTFVTGCALFVPVSVLQEIGLLDNRLFAFAEDADLSIRIRTAGYQLAYVPKARLWHEVGFSTKSQGQAYRYYMYVRNSLFVLTKHARPIQLLVAYPYFAVDSVLKLALLALLRRDWPAVLAPVKGVFGFVDMLIVSRRDSARNTKEGLT